MTLNWLTFHHWPNQKFLLLLVFARSVSIWNKRCGSSNRLSHGMQTAQRCLMRPTLLTWMLSAGSTGVFWHSSYLPAPMRMHLMFTTRWACIVPFLPRSVATFRSVHLARLRAMGLQIEAHGALRWTLFA